MTAITISPGIGSPASPATRRMPPCAATLHGSRATPATYRRRRLAASVLALGIVVVMGLAGVALGGSPLAPPERRPTAASQPATAGTPGAERLVIVRPGDTLWSIAVRLAPDDDPRPVVDTMSSARHGAPLVPGETIRWPQ
jgi:nucleoid-associated protein YgaU